MISYSKLRTGNWGIRSTTKVLEGQIVTVTKKSGEVKCETVQKIVWTDGATAWLCAIGAPVATSRRRSSGVPCGYPGCNPPAYCDDCDGEGLHSGW